QPLLTAPTSSVKARAVERRTKARWARTMGAVTLRRVSLPGPAGRWLGVFPTVGVHAQRLRVPRPSHLRRQRGVAPPLPWGPGSVLRGRASVPELRLRHAVGASRPRRRAL